MAASFLATEGMASIRGYRRNSEADLGVPGTHSSHAVSDRDSASFDRENVHMQAIQSSVANQVLLALLTRGHILPCHLVFFRDAVSEMCLDGRLVRSRSPESPEWPEAMAKLTCDLPTNPFALP